MTTLTPQAWWPERNFQLLETWNRAQPHPFEKSKMKSLGRRIFKPTSIAFFSPIRQQNPSLQTHVSHLFTLSDDSAPILEAHLRVHTTPSCGSFQTYESTPTSLPNSSGQSKPLFDSIRPKLARTRLYSTESESSPSSSIHVRSTVSSPFESAPPIDAGSSIRKPISLWPGMYHSPVTNALWEARSSIYERLNDCSIKEADSSQQSQLVTKSPSRSRTSILYKFSSDYILREQYRNPWNEIRMGKLLEDLDALAGTISLKVCRGVSFPPCKYIFCLDSLAVFHLCCNIFELLLSRQNC